MDNASLYIANELIKQINEKDSECFVWLVSSINRVLLNNRNCSLIDYFERICEVCPDITNDWKNIMLSKDLDVINGNGFGTYISDQNNNDGSLYL